MKTELELREQVILKTTENICEVWRDAKKEDPDDKNDVLVWYQPTNMNFKPNIMKVYFENNKYWYDESKRSQFDGIVLAWQYLIPPTFI